MGTRYGGTMAMQVCVHTALAAAASLLVRVGGTVAGLQGCRLLGCPGKRAEGHYRGSRHPRGKGWRESWVGAGIRVRCCVWKPPPVHAACAGSSWWVGWRESWREYIVLTTYSITLLYNTCI